MSASGVASISSIVRNAGPLFWFLFGVCLYRTVDLLSLQQKGFQLLKAVALPAKLHARIDGILREYEAILMFFCIVTIGVAFGLWRRVGTDFLGSFIGAGMSLLVSGGNFFVEKVKADI